MCKIENYVYKYKIVIDDFSYELGSGPAIIRSLERVDDGRDHEIVVTR